MAELKYKPVAHKHGEFLARARARKGFSEVYEALDPEYEVNFQMLMPLQVIAPSVAYESAFLAMLSDFERLDPGNAEFYASAKADFPAYVQSLLDEELGLKLRDGWVPCTHRWLVGPNDEVCAVARLRHTIATPFLASNGGHIGYDVAPSHRGKGYGRAALRAALAEARQLKLTRVLLFTGETNAASRAVIERQGGILESITYSEFWNEQLCKYWVAVP